MNRPSLPEAQYTGEDVGLLCAPRIQRTWSAHEIAGLVHSDLKQFVSQFPDQSQRSIEEWTKRAIQSGPQQACREMLYCEYFGVLPEHKELLFEHLKIPDRPFYNGERREDYNVTKLAFAEDMPAVLRKSSGERLKTFSAEFRDLPAHFAPEFSGMKREEARIFAMYLPKEDMREAISYIDQWRGMHVPGAFAYIRYYNVDGNIQVAEIQSDFHGRLEKRSLHEKYKHWELQLLTAFECMLSERHSVTESADSKSPRIFLPLPETVRGRWLYREGSQPKVDQDGRVDYSALAKSLANRVYGEVPGLLDYDMSLPPGPRFIECDRVGMYPSQLLSWSKPVMPVDGHPVDTFAAMMSPCLKNVGGTQIVAADELYNRLFPREVFPDAVPDNAVLRFPMNRSTNGVVLYDSLPGIVNVPVEPVDPLTIRGITREMLDVQERYLRSPQLMPVNRVLQPEFSFFSKGIEHGLPADWWKIPASIESGIQLVPIGIEEQRRHPSLRIVSGPDESGAPVQQIAVGAKGAGMTARIQGDYWIPESNSELVSHSPILRIASSDSNVPQNSSHKYWGGTLLQNAESEYRNALGLMYLFDAHKENAFNRMALPLNVAALHAVPMIEPDGTVHWTDVSQFKGQLLEKEESDHNDSLGVFISASRSDVRLSQVVNRIMSPGTRSVDSIEHCKTQILSALSYLFSINGETLRVGTATIVPHDNRIGPREYQLFINDILKDNQAAGEKIYRRIARNLISSVAMVHGAGGHLGGGFDERGGTVDGSAATIRNVDCCGALHDFDADLFLPWVLKGPKGDREALKVSQNLDVIFMKNTLYWFENLLRGRDVPAGETLQSAEILNSYNRIDCYSFAPLTLASLPGIMPNAADEKVISRQMRLFDQETHHEDASKPGLWTLDDAESALYSKYALKVREFAAAHRF